MLLAPLPMGGLCGSATRNSSSVANPAGDNAVGTGRSAPVVDRHAQERVAANQRPLGW